MKIKRTCCIFLAAVFAAVLFTAVGCTSASEASQMTITDASGKGTIISDVIIPLDSASGNSYYVKDVQKLAEHLNEKVDSLTETKDIYEVVYAGQNGNGEHIIRMTFSFDDINDYHRKAMRLYNCQPRSARNSVSGMPETYAEIAPTWKLTDNGDGTYNATFSQSAYAFTVMNLWAYQYLLNNDIENAWDNTGDQQAAQYSLFSDQSTASFVRSIGAAVTLTIGDTSKTITLYGANNTPADVSLTGVVSGTPVELDPNVTDADLVVKAPASDEISSVAQDNDNADNNDSGKANPWMLSTVAVAVVTLVAIVAVALVKKNGGKQ